MSIHHPLKVIPSTSTDPTPSPSCFSLLHSLGLRPGDPTSLPFCAGDATAGTETELQAVVIGQRETVDLAQTIEQSSYFANLKQRARAGETPERLITDLNRYLEENADRVWDNSWVRFPLHTLNESAQAVLRHDLLADKSKPRQGQRGDAARFLFVQDGLSWVRIPISYLVKLALADLLGDLDLPAPLVQTGRRLLGHYLNDNTSPETFSFHVVTLDPHRGLGRSAAREKGKRYLFTHLLTLYANRRFELEQRGQKALIYMAPQPAHRQKLLNELIPDSYYRDLFMSPCLSGWDRGEEKHRYMHLCHEVLSRSHLNAAAKLKDAGIILNNLIVLPRVSNTSLANNGTHLSLGSLRLTKAMQNDSPLNAAGEKRLGDLAIKFQEHFMPLFVGTYSAAPYRMPYSDFHPERALGFLPHQLNDTHLRMLWRRWRKKASLSVFGHPLTPFGPEWIDQTLSRVFRMRGDFVPDHRLLDYPVGLLSTDQSPGFDGHLGNQERLKRDLGMMGAFDERMSLYTFYKLREYASMGFSGFETRYFSLFSDLEEDLGQATNLQLLLTALAYDRMASGKLTHGHIPDSPDMESERRQVFFAAAVHLPTVFIARDTKNLFLQELLPHIEGVRSSRRYPGYLRIPVQAYRLGLVRWLESQAEPLIEHFGLKETLADLKRRLNHPDRFSAAGRLTSAILDKAGARDPMTLESSTFNTAAERYYRDDLRQRTLQHSMEQLGEDLMQLELQAIRGHQGLRGQFKALLPEGDLPGFLNRCREGLLRDDLAMPQLTRLIHLALLSIGEEQRTSPFPPTPIEEPYDRPPIHRTR